MRAAGVSRMIWRMACHAVHIGHDDVHQDHIRLRRARQRHRLGAVLGFGHHGEAAQPLAELAQALAHQGVVIGDQDPNRRHRGLTSLGDRRQGDDQLRALAERAVDIQRAAQVQDALAHLAQTEMAGTIGRAELAGVEAAAVVAHRDRDAAGRIHRQAHQHRTRAGVLADVVQRLPG